MISLALLVALVPAAAEVRIGDMVLDPGRMTIVEPAPQRKAALGFRAYAEFYGGYASEPWPDGIIGLSFDKEVPRTTRKAVVDACKVWSAAAAVRCVVVDDPEPPAGGGPATKRGGSAGGRSPDVLLPPDTPAPPRPAGILRVHNGPGCAAWVGYQDARGGGEMWLDPGCIPSMMTGGIDLHTVHHELGHVLGLMHEHQRTDRDDYVTIDWAQIPADLAHAYIRFSGMIAATDYDFTSIMHYGLGGPIQPKPAYARFQGITGRASVPSRGDLKAIADAYGTPSASVGHAGGRGSSAR